MCGLLRSYLVPRVWIYLESLNKEYLKAGRITLGSVAFKHNRELMGSEKYNSSLPAAQPPPRPCTQMQENECVDLKKCLNVMCKLSVSCLECLWKPLILGFLPSQLNCIAEAWAWKYAFSQMWQVMLMCTEVWEVLFQMTGLIALDWGDESCWWHTVSHRASERQRKGL